MARSNDSGTFGRVLCPEPTLQRLGTYWGYSDDLREWVVVERPIVARSDVSYRHSHETDPGFLFALARRSRGQKVYGLYFVDER